MRKLLYLAIAAAAISGLASSTAFAEETVKVTLKDGDLGFKELTVKGETRFDIENAGTREHAFEIEGEIGGEEFEVASRVLKPGGRSVFIAKLPPGTYDAYCPVDDHREKGMAGKITWASE
jgi:uncharacterized cupredoxin-like copper-binding protein